jgi:hypothetical protein
MSRLDQSSPQHECQGATGCLRRRQAAALQGGLRPQLSKLHGSVLRDRVRGFKQAVHFRKSKQNASGPI